MTIKLGINGFGRIGRNILRACFEKNSMQDMEIVAINDLGDAETNAHLIRYDTAHGPFAGSVEAEESSLIVNGHKIKVFAEKDPLNIPWEKVGATVVLECTGIFLDKTSAEKHIKSYLNIKLKKPSIDPGNLIISRNNDNK